MKRQCTGCMRSARKGETTCLRCDPGYVAPPRKPRAAKVATATLDATTRARFDDGLRFVDCPADHTQSQGDREICRYCGHPLPRSPDAQHEAAERALDEQSEAVLDANSDARMDDAMLGAAVIDEAAAFQASITSAHDHEADSRPSEPPAKPSKARKAKPAPESLLPGLEGYAKRDVSLGQWDTRPEVARAFVRWCGIERGARVLEPSAGIGNIARALVDSGAVVTCYEIDSDRASVLRERGLGEVQTADFLRVLGGTVPYDLATMNPPYENDGETTHMLHALSFAPRVCAIVRLVALASASRADAWRSVEVTRVAVLVPRPVFAGSSGMDEIAFVEIERRASHATSGASNPRLTWLDWRTA